MIRKARKRLWIVYPRWQAALSFRPSGEQKAQTCAKACLRQLTRRRHISNKRCDTEPPKILVMRKMPAGLFLIALLSTLVIDGCDHWPVPPSSIGVENGPAFLLRGKGKLATFTILGPTGQSKVSSPADFERSGVIWEIECTHGLFTGANLEGLRLTYGNVPDACHQTVPTPPQRAPTLASERIYVFHAWSSLAGVLGGDFYVQKNGAILPVDVDNCSMRNNGQWVRVNCQTQERFKEPSDIEAFALAHQRKCAFTPTEPGHSSLCDK